MRVTLCVENYTNSEVEEDALIVEEKSKEGKFVNGIEESTTLSFLSKNRNSSDNCNGRGIKTHHELHHWFRITETGGEYSGDLHEGYSLDEGKKGQKPLSEGQFDFCICCSPS